MTEIVPLSDEAVARAAALIRDGQPVAVPTETVYGLAADATNGVAVAAIYAAKGRPSFNPLIVHVPDAGAASAIAVLDGPARRLAEAFWPGPLTLVLPARVDGPVAALTRAGLPTVAVRAPAHRAMRSLLAASGRPLAAPSANASGTISPTRAEHVARSLDGRIPLIIDDGPCALGLESTIARVMHDGIALLRPGPVAIDTLAEAAGLPVVRAPAGVQAPGQLASHYAPAAAVRLDATARREGEWLIGFGAVAGDDTLSADGDLVEAACRLFDALHRADLSGRPIAVAPIPATGLGAAINDRLGRAAAER
ncbi:L-threonylcarbamoyladenylate synthase [Sphingomonas quercus]|uniref:Threonylcarbamoyl-AMP synthase n=1 Tax=Sphingomonas quercus TaxID=2842451 RepID=A0ABS6BDX2_9SPHN|nr:L-threonylcarbamoyladenylate synthase [Sphingomonas quercus]MBU3076517.1 threonylcarbamoyl-AMP synthase [Sphingomonas quercus]